MALLGVCLVYGLSPKWGDDVLDTFVPSPWYVNLPPGWRYSVVAFVILNLPAAALSLLLDQGINRVHVFSPGLRAITFLCLNTVLSVAWWRALASVGWAWQALRERQRRAQEASAHAESHDAKAGPE
jgi:hypothetical protein